MAKPDSGQPQSFELTKAFIPNECGMTQLPHVFVPRRRARPAVQTGDGITGGRPR
jgi:hypothetical protein